MVCKSSRPDGPFEVCNWSKQNPNLTDGVLAFDPAVFVDDDGRAYGYWGFERSFAAEFDPTTMATVKPGTKIVEDMISGRYDDGIFSFFEASSIRKIKDKYVFIYSRFTKDGEYNSEGFSLDGLDPLERHSAGIACWYTGPEPAVHDWSNNIFSGSYVASSYGTDSKFKAPYALENNTDPVVKNTDGSIVGYKYFNFSETTGHELDLILNLIPEGID